MEALLFNLNCYPYPTKSTKLNKVVIIIILIADKGGIGMQKRKLLVFAPLALIMAIIIGTNIGPFKVEKTMAWPYVDDNKEVVTHEKNPVVNQNQESTGASQQNDGQPVQSKDHGQVQDIAGSEIAQPPETAGQPEKDLIDPQLSFENTTIIKENGTQIVTNEHNLLVLVNKKRNLPADFRPKDLVVADVPFPFKGEQQKKYLRAKAAEALQELFTAAQNEKLDLWAASGYRSYDRQKAIFNSKAKSEGVEAANLISARPGQSEHQTGLAMDLTSSKVGFHLEEKFGDLKEGQWLKENAHKFGFIIRYPKGKEKITGYRYEPWHIRFVGKESASYIYKNGITLEEYFVKQYQYQ